MDSSELQRTFLFADLAGFSALTDAHGDERAADVAQAFRQGLHDLLSQHESQEVKWLGDGMMIQASCPGEAIRLGARIVAELGGRDGLPLARVGVATGPAVARGDDWYGRAVNVAARLCQLASPDEMLMTAGTVEAGGGQEPLPLEGPGRRWLRNLPEPVQVFRARPRRGSATGRSVDPVCRMALDAGGKVALIPHRGAVYAFCSVTCAEAFARIPGLYAGAR